MAAPVLLTRIEKECIGNNKIFVTELTGMMIAYFPLFESMGMCHIDRCLVPGLGPPSSPLVLRLTWLWMLQNGRCFEYTVNTAVCDFFFHDFWTFF